MPRVFISYSHDSADHKSKVKALADRLRALGVESYIDQYEQFPQQGWTTWMLQQIRVADFVLIVGTPTYVERFEHLQGKLSAGKGARFEGVIVSQALYESELENRTFVPVIFGGEREKSVPTILRPYTTYNLVNDEEFQDLYRLLTNQPRIIPPPLGSIEELHPESSATSVGFSQKIEDSGAVRGQRLTADVSSNVTATDIYIKLKLANHSSIPVFIKQPNLEIAENAIAKPFAFVPFFGHRGEVSPISPTEAREFVMGSAAFPVIRNAIEKIPTAHFRIRVESGSGTEIELNDPAIQSVVADVISLRRDAVDEFSSDQMQKVIHLVSRRVTSASNYGYKVFGPKILVENPALAHAPDNYERLKDQPFALSFTENEIIPMSLIELVVMTTQLINLSLEMQNFPPVEDLTTPIRISLNFNMDPKALSKPEFVAVILSKIEFAPMSAEDVLK